MTASTTVFDKLEAEEARAQRQREELIFTVVDELAVGKEVDPERVKATGLAAGELRKSVEAKQARYRQAAQIAAHTEAEAGRAAIEKEIAAHRDTARAAQAAADAAIRPLVGKLQLIQQAANIAHAARGELMKSYTGPLTAKLAELRAQTQANAVAQAKLNAELHQMGQSAVGHEANATRLSSKQEAQTAAAIRARMATKQEALNGLRKAAEEIQAQDARTRAAMLEP